jgi:hypothetical protein
MHADRIKLATISLLLLQGLDLGAAREAYAAGGLPPGLTLPPAVCRNIGKITNTTGIDFGSLSVDAAGTVVIDTNDVRTTTGGVLPFVSLSHAARFDVAGCGDYAYNIVLPDTITLSSATSSMTMNNFVSQPATTGLLDATGNQELVVGATLNVGASQAAGSYSGAFIVEVVFQ